MFSYALFDSTFITQITYHQIEEQPVISELESNGKEAVVV